MAALMGNAWSETGGEIHLPHGVTEKDQFLAAAVETLLIQIDDAVLSSIVQGGSQEFIRIAREKWRGHGFVTEDFEEAFKRITDAHAKLPKLLIKG